MASLINILLISMLFGAAAVNVVSKDKATAGVVRRELSVVSLDSGGNQIGALRETLKMAHNVVEDLACNKQFVQRDEGIDICAGTADEELINPASEILDPSVCESAAAEFGSSIEMAPRDDFELDTHLSATLPYPKGCFLNTQPKATSNLTLNKVYFNPSATNDTGGTLIGKKICFRRKFVNGTADTAGDAACTGGTVAITTYNECWAAAECRDTGDAPKLSGFSNNDTTQMTFADKPGGCFITNDLGKWGFNQNSAPAGDADGKWTGTTICMSPEPGAAGTTATTATTAAP